MSGEGKNFDQTEASPVTDYAIRRSLLGRADVVEQAKFETLLMLDDGFERRVHRLELELADDFSFGKLSSEEQRLFTSRFLVTPGRVRELAVSEALRKVISSQSTNHRLAGQHWKLNFLNFFAFERPFASAILGGVALLLFGTLSWLSVNAPAVRPPAISKQKPPPSSEKRYAHPVVSPDPKDNPSSDSGAAQQEVATITLQPESRSTSKQTVRLPNAGVVGIRLELLVKVDGDIVPSAIYEAKLMSADGLQIATFSELKLQPGSHPKVMLDLPGYNLKSGDYLIELRRVSEAGTHESERYSFMVK